MLLDTLAAAYAQSGQFSEAVKWQTKAVDVAPAGSKDGFRRRLKRYEERVSSE